MKNGTKIISSCSFRRALPDRRMKILSNHEARMLASRCKSVNFAIVVRLSRLYYKRFLALLVKNVS